VKSANGALILALGIVSFFGFGCLTGIPAWVMANASLRNIRVGVADPKDQGLVIAGRIFAILGTIMTIVAGLLALAAVLGWMGYLSFVQKAAT
jgi:hypothetical protein